MKIWRKDIGLWEERRLIWFVEYWRYSVFKNGRTVVKIKLSRL